MGKAVMPFFKDEIFYGWWIAAAALLISVVALGIRFSYGVFVESLEGEFALTRGASSGIFSIYMLLCCIFAIVGGWVSDRYGPRRLVFCMGLLTGASLILTSQTTVAWQLFISYSFFLSLGTGAIFSVVNSTTARWFVKRRGLVLGITTSGGGLGTIVIAPLAVFLIGQFDWRTALFIIGLGAGFIMALLALLLRKDPSDVGLSPDGIASETASTPVDRYGYRAQLLGPSLPQVLRTNNFWFLVISWLLLSFNVHLIMVHLVPHAVDKGTSPMDAAFIVSLTAGITLAGRIGIGRVSDVIGRKVPAILCALFQAGILLWLICSGELWMFYVFAMIFGLCWGGLSTMITALIGDVFGTRSIGAIMGVVAAGWSLGAAIGPAVGGFIFDASGNYGMAFAWGGGAMFVATLLMALVKRA
jgi:MFS family permease